MNDLEIARSINLKPIIEIAEKLGINDNELELYGKYKAKIDLSLLKRLQIKSNGRLILVTAVTPTPLGEGKTTVSIGLTQAFNKLGYNSIAALREPSMGPVFGFKGGATGGGYSQVLPMEDLNLHFTGDIHAITSATNLIAACIDNHIYQGNELDLDINNIYFKRAVDINDRSLREVKIGMGKKINGIERDSKFQITVASEIMAILCLSNSLIELKKKIGEIIIGLNNNKEFVKVKDLKIEGAIAVILKDAIKPNLVQTTENTPVIIHGGPFANIAHGCNSVLATKMALKLSDYVVTEAGFGADLGAEKFFDIKCRKSLITPDISVLVTTVKAMKYQGNGSIEDGLCNLGRHITNLKRFNIPVIVAINKYTDDSIEDIEKIKNYTLSYGVLSKEINVWANGGNGAINLANSIVDILNYDDTTNNDIDSEKLEQKDISNFDYLYKLELPIKEKIEILCKNIYGASDIEYSNLANEKIELFENRGYRNFPICMAKTPMSFSDNKDLLGAPSGYTFKINDLSLSAGAEFIVAFSGNIIDMPGLPKEPAANKINIDENNIITGLF